MLAAANATEIAVAEKQAFDEATQLQQWREAVEKVTSEQSERLKIHLIDENNVLSEDCKCCRSLPASEIERMVEIWQKSNPPELVEKTITCRGGTDMLAFGAVQARSDLGGATYFCLVYSCKQGYRIAGVPHSPVTLPKYAVQDTRSAGVRDPALLTAAEQLSRGQAFVRDTAEFIKGTPGSTEPVASNDKYCNCIGVPLLEGEPIVWFASMELHCTLGWVYKMLGYLEAELLRLDKVVLAAGGICDESLLKLYDKQRLAREEIWHLEEAASGLKSKLEILMLKREDLREKHKGAFEHLTGSKKKNKRRDDADGFDEILELDADYLRDIQIVRVEMKENEAALKKKKKANNDLHDSVFEVEGERSPLPQPLRLCLNLCVFASSSAPLPQSLCLCLNLCVFA